jgi:uncharacterized protein YciI
MDPPLYFLFTMRPKRPDFLTTMTMNEKTAMEQHFAYTEKLFDQGMIMVGGAATDGTIGIIILRADSADEARQIYEHDPAVIAGIGNTELHPFRLGLFAGSGGR